MIFVGAGSLLWRAVAEAVGRGAPVDLVCTPPGEAVPPRFVELPRLAGADINADGAQLVRHSTDGIVWSINNSRIFRAPLLGSGLRIINIHNGPLPAYRGRPEVAIIYALLAGDTSYGATLHEVDAGIDTGRVLDVADFEIGPEDGFQEVMMNGLRACHELFERNLDTIPSLPNPVTSGTNVDGNSGGGGYFGTDALAELNTHRTSPRFARATALGVFTPHYPHIAALLRQEEEAS